MAGVVAPGSAHHFPQRQRAVTGAAQRRPLLHHQANHFLVGIVLSDTTITHLHGTLCLMSNAMCHVEVDGRGSLCEIPR